MTEFGKRLKQAREHRRTTQMQLADGIGVAQSTIGSAERHGESSRYTAQIAEFLRVNAAWLATGQGSMLDEQEEQETQDPRPASRLDDDRIYDAIRWFAEQIRDRQRRKAALAKCVHVMNVAFLEESQALMQGVAGIPEQAQATATPNPAPAVDQ